jgi:hypothetical protein
VCVDFPHRQIAGALEDRSITRRPGDIRVEMSLDRASTETTE